MRRFFPSSAAALFVVLCLTGAGQPAPQRLYQAYSDAAESRSGQDQRLSQRHPHPEGEFVQIGPEGGADQGELYIQKPGQIRFEYPPAQPAADRRHRRRASM